MDELVKKCIMYRAARGLSQAEMAKICGLSRAVINYFEHSGKAGRMSRAKIAIVVSGGTVNDRA